MKTVNTFVIQLFLISGIYCIFSNAALQAKEVQGLFEVSVPVADQSDSNRRAATRQALLQVIIRTSGQSTGGLNMSTSRQSTGGLNNTSSNTSRQSAGGLNTVIASSLNKSTAYIQRYLYRETDLIDENGKQIKQLMLDLFFDEIALRSLLRDAGLPRWGANRPQVLIWIAIGNQQQRFLLGTDDGTMLDLISRQSGYGEGLTSRQSGYEEGSTSSVEKSHVDLRQTLNDVANQRGLPIMLPLMDLEDSVAIDVADVWGRFVMPIRQASQRYNSDAILAAQVINRGDTWFTRWLLLHKGSTLSWEQQSQSIEAALIAGINATADKLAEQYAVFEDSLQRNELLISVSNINQVEDYAHLMSYLQSLTSVHSLNVARMNASTLQLRLNLIGEQQTMLQAISLNNQLSVETSPMIEADGLVTQLPTLFFRWNSETQLP